MDGADLGHSDNEGTKSNIGSIQISSKNTLQNRYPPFLKEQMISSDLPSTAHLQSNDRNGRRPFTGGLLNLNSSMKDSQQNIYLISIHNRANKTQNIASKSATAE